MAGTVHSGLAATLDRQGISEEKFQVKTSPRTAELFAAFNDLDLIAGADRVCPAVCAWAAERTDSAGHQPALRLALKSHQRTGRLPKPDECPERVVDFVRRTTAEDEVPVGPGPAERGGDDP